MRRFEMGQRVVITSGADALIGKRGRVARLRFKDSQAWVAMDEQPPSEFCSFPADDEYGRGKNLLLDPTDCEAA